ncbi:MAG: HNH endonuclease [Bacteroidetes bacterium]|nr:HNH endonuclease [Bacteroidota bacterium]
MGKTTSNNNYLLKKSTSKSRGEQKKPNYTERKGLVTSRVGQGWYRQEILKKWENKCSITGCSLTEVLISSHIKSWSESNEDERLDPDNGILLSPNIDSLFDKHLITFEDDGSIIISNKIAKKDLEVLGINGTIKLKVDDGMKKYLSHHRSKFNTKS